MKNLRKNDTDYTVEAENKKNLDIKLVSRDQQLDFGGNDDDDSKDPQDGMGIVNDRDNETPIMKEETLVPKLADKPVNIFQKKTEGVIGRASMKGFMKEELEELSQKAMKGQPPKNEETKGPEAKKTTEDKNA